MAVSATERFGVAVAPGGLFLAQELLNTAPSGRQQLDLLGSLADAQSWLDAVVEHWADVRDEHAPQVALAQADLAPLRRLRESVSGTRSREHGDAGRQRDAGRQATPAAPVDLSLADDGRTIVASPRGSGARWVRSAVLLAIYEAQLVGSDARLKICANPVCNVAFYDQSKNKSAAWHDFAVCGNAANLRAFRQRRRAAAKIA